MKKYHKLFSQERQGKFMNSQKQYVSRNLFTTDGFHPIINWDIPDLRNKLELARQDGLVKVNRGANGLEVFNYTNYCAVSRGWNAATLIARGLILRGNQVVGLGFPKFFNHDEHFSIAGFYPSGNYRIVEKMDGSLGICFFDEVTRKWMVSTRGSLHSPQAGWATAHLRKQVGLGLELDEFSTYLTEIIYPQNRIVVDYGEDRTGLTFLGGYDNTTYKSFSEIPRDAMNYLHMPKVLEDSITPEFVIEHVLPDLPWNQEGYVVEYDSGERIKLKGKDYCFVHNIIHDYELASTPLQVWRMMLAGEDISDFDNENIPETLLERTRVKYEVNKLDLGMLLANLMCEYDRIKAEWSDKNVRDAGIYVKENASTINAMERRFIIQCALNSEMTFELGTPERTFLYKLIQPKGNVIPSLEEILS